ncbi:CBL-interacting serine/threonine-protein kinase 17 [Tritrichomonas foetus]|uniref:non-specific serine/threonine protein kinase n=1 Tax=Tritrichomonas foetus TaxID=1144522 RepID=A0A1J4JQJ4_9EUKA|nr:CBL-interacting serine/threonine-protein kinase 17 [Tritrichomonas foetus]|eukprot:OHS99508.1 CBL-interacting serine/threonine-protein kinase 17 [Tritrichomonas foetus]
METDAKAFTVGCYQIGKKIGQGSFAKVREGIHIPTQTRVAVKVISKKSFENDADAHQRFSRELRAFSSCEHPFIARFYDLVEEDANYYIIQELAEGGNMLDMVNSKGKLSIEEIRHYFTQILSAIEYLHKKMHVMHRDLKAENVLLDRNYNVRLIDFGLCNILQCEEQIMNTAVGSPAYAPPEMIQGHSYNHAADIWSLGILLFAIANCQLPFEDANTQRLLHKIVFTQPNYPPSFPLLLTDLLKRMLDKNPETRITLDEIKAHPFVADYVKTEKIIQNCSGDFDDIILSQLGKQGYDVNKIVQDIQTNKSSQESVAYHICKRKIIMNQMKIAGIMKSEKSEALIRMSQSDDIFKPKQPALLPSIYGTPNRPTGKTPTMLIAKTPPKPEITTRFPTINLPIHKVKTRTNLYKGKRIL